MGESEGRARPKYLKMGESSRVGEGAPSNDNAPAVTLTRGELGALVREAVGLALEAERGAPRALLLDRQGLAALLGCSAALVDKFRRRGMPAMMLGDSPRFELEACLGWLRKDGAA